MALPLRSQRVRAKEVKVLLGANFLRGLNEALFFVQSAVLSFLVFVAHYLLGNVLKAHQVERSALEEHSVAVGTLSKVMTHKIHSSEVQI